MKLPLDKILLGAAIAGGAAYAVWALTQNTGSSGTAQATTLDANGVPQTSSAPSYQGGTIVLPGNTLVLPPLPALPDVIFNYSPPTLPPSQLLPQPAPSGTTSADGGASGGCGQCAPGAQSFGGPAAQAGALDPATQAMLAQMGGGNLAGAALGGVAAILNTPEAQQAFAWKQLSRRSIGAEDTVMAPFWNG